ncbi:(2Fe-2S)-binding protein [Thermomicrobiaceae bacterium CFH 74404]|uniref:(2Fe-2S)-binding protein n=1 Tax=Thermalbibacter longus TaxID=2951981 RepID=A0AA41WH27_9BACT|nr:(2Fe-2S)-binding protein [Thermalbibacter longus]MCM8750310.1 (2Fe-2S)-binding protein [Thermalbibacter longus]
MTYRPTGVSGQSVSLSSPPIQQTLARATARCPQVSARWGLPPEGWWLAADIVSDPSAVSELLDQLCCWYEMDDRQVAASFLVLAYFWYLLCGAVACYFLERRVPDLSAGAVALHLRQGVAFLSPRCWALPDDPAAGHPAVLVVADEDALRRQLVDQLEREHAEPLFSTLRRVAPFGLVGMRANYVDRLASVVLWLAEQLGDQELARREVPALVALAGPKARTGILEIECEGRSGLVLRRGGCCLNYRLPGREKCDTCCLRPLEERAVLLRRYLAPGEGAASSAR